MTKDFILTIYSLPQTVFTLGELSLLFPKLRYLDLKSKVSYFVKVGKIKKVRRGIYTKGEYSSLELANKIYTPSYISFETVLQKEGVVFQYDETIHVASYLSREVAIDGYRIRYRHLADDVLVNMSGVEKKDQYFIASKERAFLDAVFLYKNYHFDNLGGLDWDKIFSLQSIYQSKVLVKRIKLYYKAFKEENVQ